MVGEKLRRSSLHWMRHAHASHDLARGAELTTVRDNRRHASVAITSTYLQRDEVKRARQMDQTFAARCVFRQLSVLQFPNSEAPPALERHSREGYIPFLSDTCSFSVQKSYSTPIRNRPPVNR